MIFYIIKICFTGNRKSPEKKIWGCKKTPLTEKADRKIAQTVRSERFFGIINYATK